MYINIKFLIVLIFVSYNFSSAANVSIENATSIEIQAKPTTAGTTPVDNTMDNIMNGVYKLSSSFMMELAGNRAISKQCKKGLWKTMLGVTQMKTWALKMIDASGVKPNGLFSGTLMSYGDYDLCLDIAVPRSFQGQYCLLEISIPFINDFAQTVVSGHEKLNFTEYMTSATSDKPKSNSILPKISVCLPSTCSQSDVSTAANMVAKKVKDDITVTVWNCDRKKERAFTSTDIIIMCVLSIVVFLCISATLYEMINRSKNDKSDKTQENPFSKILLCFSLKSNMKKLLDENNANEISIFNAMKVLAMATIILLHTYGYLNEYVLGHGLYFEKFTKRFLAQFILNSNKGVEAFFFISSVILARSVMKREGTKFNAFRYFRRRIYRLLPSVIFIMALARLVIYIGAGPLWEKQIQKYLRSNCDYGWWKNLIFINSYYPMEQQCVGWLWYVSAEIHLYTMALIILVIIKRRPKLGWTLNGICCIICAIVVAASAFYYTYPPAIILTNLGIGEYENYIENGYLKWYLHIIASCTGIVIGYFLTKKKSIQIPLTLKVLGWIAAIGLGMIIVFMSYGWNNGMEYNATITAVYSVSSQIIWNLIFSWITIVFTTGSSENVTSRLKWKPLLVLGRVTFDVYLVHPLFIHTYLSSIRQPVLFAQRVFIMLFLGCLVAGFVGGLIFHLLFQLPFSNLFNMMENKPEKEQPHEVQKAVEMDLVLSTTKDVKNV